MNSIVSPAESTARYRYVQFPATFIWSHHPPGTVGTSEFAAKPLVQKGRMMLNPAPDRDVIHGQAALCHDLLHIAVA
jgi:hypothetical protein